MFQNKYLIPNNYLKIFSIYLLNLSREICAFVAKLYEYTLVLDLHRAQPTRPPTTSTYL